MPTEILTFVLVALGILTVAKMVTIVPQGYQYTIERFGKYVKTFTPGFHWKIPWMETIGRKINMMEQVLNVPSQEVITKDNAVVTVDGVVFYQVLDPAKARTVLGSMDLDESLSKRDEINHRLLAVVDEATSPWGIKVTQSEILRAEGEKRAAILQAEGQKEAAFREAEARERLAEAEANATKAVSGAIKQGGTEAINYFVAQKYVEAFGKFADSPNQKTLILPMEATGILGSLSGIAEIAKSTFGEDKKSGDAS